MASLFGTERVTDDLEACVTTFLQETTRSLPIDLVEIEAKFGIFVDKGTGQRVQLPVASECILSTDNWTKFVSDMPTEFHRRFNELLNRRVTDKSQNWKYSHTKTNDQRYNDGVRITSEVGSGRVIEAMKKRRIADLSIFMPRNALDIRISVNIEESVNNPSNNRGNSGLVVSRFKDRFSYRPTDGLVQIDLTQVQQQESQGRREIRHELEVEVVDAARLLNSPNLIQTFLMNLRELSRALN